MASEVTNLTIEQLQRALEIKAKIAALEAELNAISGGQAATSAPKSTGGDERGNGRRKGKRTMSAEARARIAAAQKARWAAKRGETAPVSTPVKTKAPEGQLPKKRQMSAEGRARIIAATKARWAKLRGEKANGAVTTTAKPKAAVKRTMSEEARAKIAAVARDRWKKAKAAGKTTL